MDRKPSSLFLLALFALGASMTACAGNGPPVIEHPRSPSITAVSVESDPLAGTIVIRPGETALPPAVATRPVRALALPSRPDLVSARTSRVAIDVGAWNLALGDEAGEARMAPDVAFSAALTLSGGAAPQLSEPPSSIAVHRVSEQAVEEGAWEASRR